MRRLPAPLLTVFVAACLASAVTAQTDLSIEFNEDDQPGFDLWPPLIQYLQRDQRIAPDEAHLPIITSQKPLQSTCGSPIRQEMKQ